MGELFEITMRSLLVSGTATLLSASWSIPIAYALSGRPRAARFIMPGFEALVGLPTVLVGLMLYGLLSRNGPLGFLDLLYTPLAISIGESLLITPLLVSVSYRVLRRARETYGELALSLGASPGKAMQLALSQAIPGLVAAGVMAFSRAVGELGVALLVGGNIRGETRVLTTAIALEVSKGSYETALYLGAVLLVLTLGVSTASRILARWEV